MIFTYEVLFGTFLVLVGAIFLFVGLRWISSNELQPRLKKYVNEPDEQSQQWSQVVTARTQELSGSITNRLFLPFIRSIGDAFSRLTPASSVEALQKKMYIAGNPLGLGAREFYGIRLAFVLLGIWSFFIFWQRSTSNLQTLAAISILLFCLLIPNVWLRWVVSAGHRRVRKGLPDALDMLSVCVDAGLGFDQSLQRVSEYWKTPIAMEFGRVITEIEMGLSRQEALRNLADRLDLTEVSSFVAIILQSDKLGMSIADTLHVQAEQMRVERRFRAQEQARTTPIKMLIPLAFLIFPALMAILLGPALPPIIGLFNNL